MINESLSEMGLLAESLNKDSEVMASNKRMLGTDTQNKMKLDLLIKKIDEIEEKIQMMKKLHNEVVGNSNEGLSAVYDDALNNLKTLYERSF